MFHIEVDGTKQRLHQTKGHKDGWSVESTTSAGRRASRCIFTTWRRHHRVLVSKCLQLATHSSPKTTPFSLDYPAPLARRVWSMPVGQLRKIPDAEVRKTTEASEMNYKKGEVNYDKRLRNVLFSWNKYDLRVFSRKVTQRKRRSFNGLSFDKYAYIKNFSQVHEIDSLSTDC